MSIPASSVVQVNPGVLPAGGNPLSLNSLYLTQNALMPNNTVLGFPTTQAVINFFGPASDEATLAPIYFAGFSNSTIKPGSILFASFNAAVRAAFLQSGNLAGLTLTALKALSGVLTISQDGVVKTSSAITLTGATSFSNAATLIAAGFTSGPAVTWNPVNSTFVFTSPTTGASSSMSFATGSLAAGLSLTQALGAIVSTGAVADTPATAMSRATNLSQNFATFQTVFEPVTADKQNFAVWSSQQNSRYLYLGWDSDPLAITPDASATFGAICALNQYDGVICLSGDPNLAIAQGTTLAITARALASFVGGMVASINFGAPTGRISAAFKSQPGLSFTVADQTLGNNLLGNGYSFYGSYATANQGFVFFYDGTLPGKFKKLGAFVNQIWMNSQFQLTLLTLQTTVNVLNYNPPGYGLIREALSDPIGSAVSFGAIQKGVILSSTQAAQVNQQAGLPVAPIIQTEGYYLQILDPGAEARAANLSPTINFWYTDGGEILRLVLGSTDIL